MVSYAKRPYNYSTTDHAQTRSGLFLEMPLLAWVSCKQTSEFLSKIIAEIKTSKSSFGAFHFQLPATLGLPCAAARLKLSSAPKLQRPRHSVAEVKALTTAPPIFATSPNRHDD